MNKNTIYGEVRYGFIENEVKDQEKAKNKELYQLIDQINNKASNLEFVLQFNSVESLFYLEEQMESDLNPMVISFAKNIVSKGKYYCNIKKDILLREVTNNYDQYTLVQSKPSSIKWVLTKETKRIGKFKCYKATTIKTKINSSGSYKYIIEAWYTTQVPVPFGPNEFVGLPGLILELKDSHYTLYAKKVNIKDNVKTKILPLTSKNIITIEEHKKNIEKSYQNLKETFRH